MEQTKINSEFEYPEILYVVCSYLLCFAGLNIPIDTVDVDFNDDSVSLEVYDDCKDETLRFILPYQDYDVRHSKTLLKYMFYIIVQEWQRNPNGTNMNNAINDALSASMRKTLYDLVYAFYAGTIDADVFQSVH